MRLPWRTSRDRGSRLGRILLVSLWLHLSLLLLFLVSVRYNHPEEMLPPPATVAMVFEGGRPEGPTAPNPHPFIESRPAPPVPESPPPAPAPAPQAVAPPLPPLPSAPAEPIPPPPAPPPEPAPASPAPPPPPVAMAVPLPAPPPLRAPPPVSPQPRPEPPRAAPSRPPAFPAPMNFSFGQPTLRPASPRAEPRSHATLDFSLGTTAGATDNTPFSRIAGAHVGPDWRNLLSAWVRDHAYYPPQAVFNGEDGTVKVRVAAEPNGHVTRVELEQRSGSVWLDTALLAMFRDANLPPLHTDDGITFDFTMHYILIR